MLSCIPFSSVSLMHPCPCTSAFPPSYSTPFLSPTSCGFKCFSLPLLNSQSNSPFLRLFLFLSHALSTNLAHVSTLALTFPPFALSALLFPHDNYSPSKPVLKRTLHTHSLTSFPTFQVFFSPFTCFALLNIPPSPQQFTNNQTLFTHTHRPHTWPSFPPAFTFTYLAFVHSCVLKLHVFDGQRPLVAPLGVVNAETLLPRVG